MPRFTYAIAWKYNELYALILAPNGRMGWIPADMVW